MTATAKPARTARRRAREMALQALYAWQLAGGDAEDVLEQARGFEDWARGDVALAETLIRDAIARAGELEARIAPHLIERRFAQLSPVERAILYIGALELDAHPRTPLKVVLNEAIDLGKSFGGEAGHRLVNGVLERVAAALRPAELARLRQTV